MICCYSMILYIKIVTQLGVGRSKQRHYYLQQLRLVYVNCLPVHFSRGMDHCNVPCKWGGRERRGYEEVGLEESWENVVLNSKGESKEGKGFKKLFRTKVI